MKVKGCVRRGLATSVLPLAALLSATSAHAVDGTVTITGSITDASCTIDIDGGTGGDYTLALPVVGISSFKSVGNSAGATQFNFNLSECTGTDTAPTKVRAHFEAINVDVSTGNLLNMAMINGASGIEVQIANADGQPIDLRDNKNNNYADIDAENGSATMSYVAQYVSVDPAVTAGTVNAQLMYSLEYL
ncbi:hypothetical secreted protein [Pseudomonas knackmussii B13]|uniref:Hypothetical secreted protein n=1 Tax=Pseudomonas knackmussii (strain DSM 6978 / CCUG 54928 / LMG 23759 / B13) TaxID=1301098 RepID=A0A024HFX0_PSEKB|nr:fimbrial protein [Pseudomonas knackmussii]CDF83397.1 hypothetical secreted protein [Pseudomonas knackmussii B13]